MDDASATPAEADDAHTLRLGDGRRIGVAMYGERGGFPVLYFPGLGDSRLTVPPPGQRDVDGVRLIAIDPPGVGLSDPTSWRSVSQCAGDVVELAALLDLDRFAVFGWSAGGPHALAVAQRWPDRVTRAGIACGFAPFDRAEVRRLSTRRMAQAASVMRRLPFLASLFTRSLPGQYRKDPRAAFEKQFGAMASPSDRELLDDPAVGEQVMRGAVEAVRQGHAGQALEMKLLLAYRWGFEPEQVTVPTHLWYGADDLIVTPATGEHLQRAIPGSTLTVFPGEGHMLPFAHWREMIATLSAA